MGVNEPSHWECVAQEAKEYEGRLNTVTYNSEWPWFLEKGYVMHVMFPCIETVALEKMQER
jgi:hypothetical protein